MKKMFIEVNQIHNFMSSSGSGTVINYGSGSGSDFLTTYGSGSTTLITALCIMGGGGSLEPRTAIEGSFSAWGGRGKLDRGLSRGETFFHDSDSDRDSDRDSDETFQISQNLGLIHVEFFCLLDSQPCIIHVYSV
jgi:hypothetical protein